MSSWWITRLPRTKPRRSTCHSTATGTCTVTGRGISSITSSRSTRRHIHPSTARSFRRAKSLLWPGRHSISVHPPPSGRASSSRTSNCASVKDTITTGCWTGRREGERLSCARRVSSTRRAAAHSRSAPANQGSSFTRATSWTARSRGSMGWCTAIAPRSVSRRSISPIHRTTPTSRPPSCDRERPSGRGPSSCLAWCHNRCVVRGAWSVRASTHHAPRTTHGFCLHAAALRRRRQDAVQPQVVRFLAVVIRPVADRDQDRGRAGERVRAEELNRLGELRIVQLGERLLAELERLPQPSDELVLGHRAVHGAALRRGHAGGLTAQLIVALIREVDLNLREAHLRRRRPVVVLLRWHRLVGGDQNAPKALLHLAERVRDGARRRRVGWGGRRAGGGLRSQRQGQHGAGDQGTDSRLHINLRLGEVWILSKLRVRR